MRVQGISHELVYIIKYQTGKARDSNKLHLSVIHIQAIRTFNIWIEFKSLIVFCSEYLTYSSAETVSFFHLSWNYPEKLFASILSYYSG